MASLGVAIALGLAFFLDLESVRAVCIYRLTLGLPCPGCGLTRATVHLLHGDLTTSLRLHPFGVLLALEAAVLWTIIGVRVHRGLPIGMPRGVERWALGHVVAMLALWVGRVASGTKPF